MVQEGVCCWCCSPITAHVSQLMLCSTNSYSCLWYSLLVAQQIVLLLHDFVLPPVSSRV